MENSKMEITKAKARFAEIGYNPTVFKYETAIFKNGLNVPGIEIYYKLKNGTATLKEARDNPLYIKLSYSNLKLQPNETNSWLIWNIPAVITCPYRTAHCEQCCYAVKAEKAYKSAKNKRLENLKLSQQSDFVKRMIYTIYVELFRAEKANKALNIRLHESGDFYNRSYLEKWLTIITEFQLIPDVDINIYCYTKSLPLFENETEFKLLNIRASVWDDTDNKSLEIINKYDLPIYTAYTAEVIENKKANGEKFFKCRCKDCATCRACCNGKVKKIICEIH